jgi:hypothetical protein
MDSAIKRRSDHFNPRGARMPALRPAIRRAPPTDDPAIGRISREFVEMPGLRLTPAQAQRLWSLDPATCASMLDRLVASKFLTRMPDGRYGRRSPAANLNLPLRMSKAHTPRQSRLSKAR